MRPSGCSVLSAQALRPSFKLRCGALTKCGLDKILCEEMAKIGVMEYLLGLI